MSNNLLTVAAYTLSRNDPKRQHWKHEIFLCFGLVCAAGLKPLSIVRSIIIDAVTTIAVVVLVVIGLLMVWRNDISSDSFVLLEIRYFPAATVAKWWKLSLVFVFGWFCYWTFDIRCHSLSEFVSLCIKLNSISVIDRNEQAFEESTLSALPTVSHLVYSIIRDIDKEDVKPYCRFMISIHINDEHDIVFLYHTFLIDLFVLLVYGSQETRLQA